MGSSTRRLGTETSVHGSQKALQKILDFYLHEQASRTQYVCSQGLVILFMGIHNKADPRDYI